MSPRDRSPVRTPSPRQPLGKHHWNQLRPYNLTFLKLEQTNGSSGQRGTGPQTEPGFSKGFLSILSPMEFWFLAAVASGLLSLGTLNFQRYHGYITKLNNAFRNAWKFNWKLSVKSCHFTLLTHYFPFLILCSCFVTICIFKSAI